MTNKRLHRVGNKNILNPSVAGYRFSVATNREADKLGFKTVGKFYDYIVANPQKCLRSSVIKEITEYLK